MLFRSLKPKIASHIANLATNIAYCNKVLQLKLKKNATFLLHLSPMISPEPRRGSGGRRSRGKRGGRGRRRRWTWRRRQTWRSWRRTRRRGLLERVDAAVYGDDAAGGGRGVLSWSVRGRGGDDAAGGAGSAGRAPRGGGGRRSRRRRRCGGRRRRTRRRGRRWTVRRGSLAASGLWSREWGFGEEGLWSRGYTAEGLWSRFVARTGTKGSLVPVRATNRDQRVPLNRSGSSGDPLVPVDGTNRDQRPFSPRSCHEPGPKVFFSEIWCSQFSLLFFFLLTCLHMNFTWF